MPGIESPTGESVVIDGGTGIRQLGLSLASKQAGKPLHLHCFLTHFHWDHIQGIPFLPLLYSPANTVTFHSSHTPDQAREVLEGQMSSPYFPVNFELLAARRHFVDVSEKPTKYGDLTVHAFPLNHPQGASGYRLERNGVAIVHASDLEHGNPHLDSVLREYAQNADVLVYDAQFTPEEYESRRGWGHSTWLEATRVAKDAGVKRLVLIHHDPSHDDAVLRNIRTEARQEFEHTDIAEEGWHIDL